MALLEELTARIEGALGATVPIHRMRVYEALGRTDELAAAVEAGEAMLAATGRYALQDDVVSFTGRLHEMRGDWRAAIDSYQRLREIDPTDSTIPARIGRCHRELGDLDRAAALILETLAVLPSHARSHYELALVRERQGRTADAITHLQRALQTWAHADEDHMYAALARQNLAALQGA